MSSANAPFLFMNGYAFLAAKSRHGYTVTTTEYILQCFSMQGSGAYSFGRSAGSLKDEPHKGI